MMIKNLLVLVTFLLSGTSHLYSQWHDAVWLYGANSAFGDPRWGTSVLDFSTEPPTVYEQEREMNLDVTVAAMCDSTGSLLFYTNGVWIANHQHGMMENGDSLNPGELTWDYSHGGLITFQSAIALPYPEHPEKYFLLHLKLDYHDVIGLVVNTFYYSLIDMEFNNGLGTVLEKNVELLTDGTLGTITAVKHGNGRDWWVVVSDFFGHFYRFFLLSPSGIEFISEQGFGSSAEGINGTISFSPDGSKMAQYEVPLQNVAVYDFDRCNGTLDNQVIISVPGVSLGGGQAFSPSGRFLYLVSSDFVLQADLWADDIAASLDTVAVYDCFTGPSTGGLSTTFFSMQAGPDGRLYFYTNNGTMFLHYIQYPNRKGDSCTVVQHGVELPFFNIFTSPHFPNYHLGPLDGSPCDTLGLDNVPLAGFRHGVDTVNTLLAVLTDNSHYQPSDWLWDFGDSGSSTLVDPVHEYADSGTYEVCLTVSNQYGSDTACREVRVEAPVTLTTEVPGAVQPDFVLFPNPAGRKLP